MESRNRNYAQSVQRNWQRQVHDGEYARVHSIVGDDKFSRKLIQLLCSFFRNVRSAVGILWKIGSASRRMDAKNIEIPRCAMERFGIASRRIHQQAKRRVTIKVSIHPGWVVLAQCSHSYWNFPFVWQSRTLVGSSNKTRESGSINEMGGTNSGGRCARHGRNSTNAVGAWLRSICKSTRLWQSRFMGER